MTTDRAAAARWLNAGDERLRGDIAALGDADPAAPTRLPGWHRGHLLTHLARNADALVNLLTWARTGEKMPMYASADQRAADIKAGADRSWPDLVADLAEAGDRLWAAMVAMQRDAWAARVQTAQGRDVPAATVVWMRVREVWIHAVDLGAGTDYTDFPGSLVDALLDDVTAAFTARGTAPAVRLAPTDRRRVWTVGADPSAGAVDGDGELVSAPAARIAAWLTGRDRLEGAPDLPPWL